MPLDPSIPLRVNQLQLTPPIQQRMQVLGLQEAEARRRASQQEEAAAQQQAQTAERFRAIVQKHGGLVKDGAPNEELLREVGETLGPGFELNLRTDLGKALPKPPEPYTLGLNQRRFGPNNQVAGRQGPRATPTGRHALSRR
jgi:hypothetical protein